MKHYDDDQAIIASDGPVRPLDVADEAELARRAGAGDQRAFDLLYDRYFARTSWYFTIFGRREAKVAVDEVLRELFGSLNEPSDLSLAERAYRLSIATELRHATAPAERVSVKRKPAKVGMSKSSAARPLPSRI